MPATDGGAIEVIDPATEERIATVSATTAPDVDQAVQAARCAFDQGPWPPMSGGRRAKLIWSLAERLAADSQVLAELETLDNGKPFSDTLAIDIPVGAELLRYMGGWATKLKGETVQAHHVGGPDLPIGGYKQLGWGRELGREGIEMYTELKAVAIALKKPGNWLELKG